MSTIRSQAKMEAGVGVNNQSLIRDRSQMRDVSRNQRLMSITLQQNGDNVSPM